MANDGTSFQIGIGVPSSGVASADAGAASVDALAASLERADAATKAMSAELKASEASYRSAESAANKAAVAVERVGLQAEAQRGKLAKALEVGDASGAERARAKLAELTARESELAVKANSAKTALDAQAASLDKVRAGADAASKKEAELGKKFDAAKAAQEKSAGSGKFNEAAEALGKLGGPLGDIGQKVFGAAGGLGKLSSSLGAAGPYAAVAVAIVAIVAGMAALSVAAAVATVKVAAWSVQMADASRTSQLLSAGIARSVEGGKELDATLDNLVTQVPATREELQQMASGLADSGLRGKALSDALEVAAVKAAKLKFGPEFGKELLSLSNQSKRFQTNIAGTFGGLKIDKLLEAMSTLVALFDQSTASGRAMKAVFESLFQPLIDGATELAPKIVAAFIQAEIWALRAGIAIKPYASKILLVAEAFGIVAGVLLVLVGVLVGLVLSPLIALGALLVAIAAGVLLFSDYTTAALDAAYAFGQSLIDGPIAAFNDLKALDVVSIGTDIVDGLVQGVKDAGPALIKALTDVANSAVDAAKKALKISSPSAVMADEVGYQMGAGAAVGIDAAAPMVQTSLEQMTAPPLPGGAEVSPIAPAASSSSGSSAGLFAGAIFNLGSGSTRSMAEEFMALVEELAAQRGLGKPEPT